MYISIIYYAKIQGMSEDVKPICLAFFGNEHTPYLCSSLCEVHFSLRSPPVGLLEEGKSRS